MFIAKQVENSQGICFDVIGAFEESRGDNRICYNAQNVCKSNKCNDDVADYFNDIVISE